MTIKDVIKSYDFELMDYPNVVGVAQGQKTIKGIETDEVGLVILVRKKKPRSALDFGDRIPGQIQGVVTDVIEVGHLRAFGNTGRVRPLKGGYSIGHWRVTAGTLGYVVFDGTSGDPYILSNNHVLAESNDAEIGDDILQPGPIDGGSPTKDLAGKLYAFAPIDFGEEPPDCEIAGAYAQIGNWGARIFKSKHRVGVVKQDAQAVNQIDAALATPLVEIEEFIEGIGKVSDISEAYIGMGVQKSGRTTGFTTGKVELIHATVSVDYGEGRIAVFENQILSGAMSQGGDSGSLLVSRDNLKAVGLLFAGSNQVTIYNPIAPVLDYFGVYIND